MRCYVLLTLYLLITQVMALEVKSTVTKSLTLTRETSISMSTEEQAQLDQIQQTSIKTMYPLKSELTPGKVTTTQAFKEGYVAPFFVIGDDAYSLQWLKANAALLNKQNAIGMVTNVGSQARVNAIKVMTGIDELAPVSLDGFADMFHVQHYPFVMCQGVLTQDAKEITSC